MTKKEREELKKEIVAEVLKELQATKLTQPKTEYGFAAYKEDVVKDDLAKVEAFITKGRKWTWFIPLVGFYIYAYRLQQLLNSLDRGAMRVAIAKYQARNTAWYLLVWMICLPMIFNVQTWIDWPIFKKAVKEVKANLEQNQKEI